MDFECLMIFYIKNCLKNVRCTFCCFGYSAFLIYEILITEVKINIRVYWVLCLQHMVGSRNRDHWHNCFTEFRKNKKKLNSLILRLDNWCCKTVTIFLFAVFIRPFFEFFFLYFNGRKNDGNFFGIYFGLIYFVIGVVVYGKHHVAFGI